MSGDDPSKCCTEIIIDRLNDNTSDYYFPPFFSRLAFVVVASSCSSSFDALREGPCMSPASQDEGMSATGNNHVAVNITPFPAMISEIQSITISRRIVQNHLCRKL